MFRVRHGRVTSLAPGMLRMIVEGHTLCDPPRPVNAERSDGNCPPAMSRTKQCHIVNAPERYMRERADRPFTILADSENRLER